MFDEVYWLIDCVNRFVDAVYALKDEVVTKLLTFTAVALTLIVATEPTTEAVIDAPTKFNAVAEPNDTPSSLISTPLPDSTNASTCASNIAILPLNDDESIL